MSTTQRTRTLWSASGSATLRTARVLAAITIATAAARCTGASPAPPAHVVYSIPEPGARDLLPVTTLAARFDRGPGRGDASHVRFEVTGSRSGRHAGSVTLSDDARTFVFRPDLPFAWGERVQALVVRSDRTGPPRPVGAFAFTIAAAPEPATQAMLPAGSIATAPAPDSPEPISPPALSTRVVSPATIAGLPDDFPELQLIAYATTPPGCLFLATFSIASATPYLIILDASGTPIFYRRMPGPCLDFKPQPDGHLTYFMGAKFYVMDSTYAVVDSIACGNGYLTDVHELRLLANGHALLIGMDPHAVDMSARVAGGNRRATVVADVVQELDAHRNVVFQWRSWDHLQIEDATHEDLTAALIDYVHANAIEPDTDGNLLMSSRHLDEITKISRVDGSIVWRWGGKHNMFTFLGDTMRFSHQHAIRRLANGHLTLFDNGNYHRPQFSRAMEYVMDEAGRTVTAVWEYAPGPPAFGPAMGYVQRQDSGATLVAWGFGKPDMTEVAADGTLLTTLRLPAGQASYRMFRYPWGPAGAAAVSGGAHPWRLDVGPNPARGRVALSLALPHSDIVDAHVADVSGRVVSTIVRGGRLGAGLHHFDVELSHLRAGIYFCRVTVGGASEVRKLVVVR